MMTRKKADQPDDPTPQGAVNTDKGGRPLVDDDGRPSTDGYVTTESDDVAAVVFDPDAVDPDAVDDEQQKTGD